jgi:hypothetical protein
MNITWKDRWELFRLMRTVRIARLESGIPTSWGFIDWMILTFPTWWHGNFDHLKDWRKYSWEEMDEFVRKAEENPPSACSKWFWNNGWKFNLSLFLLFILLFVGSFAHCQTTCPDLPLPTLQADTVKVCHTGYISLYDTKARVPRLVIYELTRERSLGCLPRKANFHSEGQSAKPTDYKNSGYDLGHMMPAEDGSWSDAAEYDSFSMVNVAPQLPGLNRQEWERLEEAVRAWAWQRGDVLVYVGPILSDQSKKLGDITIPDAFFKIIVDRATGDMLAFEMPQQTEAKGDLTPWIRELPSLQYASHMVFPFQWKGWSTLWPLDLSGWRQAHKTACSR